MINSISKYFLDAEDNQNEFYLPAQDNDISELEKQLGTSLPNDYKEFLKFTNGFDGQINEFFVSFDPVEKIYQRTLDTCANFFPWAIYLGTNGNLEMFVIDKRQKEIQFGLLPFIGVENDFIPLGKTFETFIEHLYDNTAFESK